MKKIIKQIGKFFHHIGLFFDKWLITPITKLILVIMNYFKDNSKNFDKFAGKKSTLLVISLILAAATFVIVDQESNVMIDQYAEVLYNQQVTAVYNEELYVVEGLPKTVDITLVGQRRHIFLAKQSPSKGVSVDLTGLKPGNHKVTLKYTQRLKSLDYRLDPSTVTVTIYEKVSDTRSLTYDVLHKDSLDKKLYISDVELDRTDVIIKGAEYKLEQVASVKALVDVNEIPNPKAGEIELKDVPLVAYDTDGRILSDVEIVPKTVKAKITITSPSKEVPIKVVPDGDLAFGKSIKSMELSTSTVTVYGEQDAIDKIEQLEVTIDTEGLDENKEYHVTLKKPKGITELSTKTLTIKVVLDNSISKEFENLSIQFRNLGANYKVQALT
ncbi:MAG: CdaR family protein, partial [Mycoplasmatota bacterium]|nr:CdaR family protein [Mycoplasmatota bacterium]